MSLLPTQGPPSILSAQTTFRHRGPPLGGTGPPLNGTRASSRYRGLPQSLQHRGVGPFGSVSLLPTQGPPSILSAQTTEPTSTEGLLSAQGASSRHRASSNPLSTEYPPAQRAPSRHRGLLSAAQGTPLGGMGPPLSGTRASSRHRGLPESPQHRGVGPFSIVSLLTTQGPPPILSAQTTFRHRGSPLGTGASSRRHMGLL